MEILRAQLDDEQLAIAVDSAGSRLVLAGPGSGKTRLLTNVAAYQVRRTPESRFRVLSLTFSVEATSEMRRRLADRSLGVRGSRRIHVSNFHQLGGQILHAYADQAGWPRNSQMIGDGAELLEEAVQELRLGRVNMTSLSLALQRLRNARPTPNPPVQAETLRRVQEVYEARKLERGLWDFGDLITRTLELIDSAPRVLAVLRSMFGYILVDELQDTSGQQLELIARLSGEGEIPVFGVADDDQMIYAWLDARPENLREFQSRFAVQEVYLVGNYRCPPRVVAAANAIIAPIRPEGVRPAESRVGDRPGQVLVSAAPAMTDHPAQVAGLLRAEIDAGVRPEKIAVLAAVAFKFKDLKPAIEAAGIPCVHVGDRSLSKEPAVRILLAALATQQQQDVRSMGRLSRTLADVLVIDDEDELKTLCRRLMVPASPDRIFAEAADIADLEGGGELDMHIRRIIHAAAGEGIGLSPQQAATSILIEWNRLDAKTRREDASVKLMTTFGAKGLEFDTIVLPYFDSELVPYAPRGQVPNMEDERRKLYVALTRARRRVVLAYAGQPSIFVAELAGVAELWSRGTLS